MKNLLALSTDKSCLETQKRINRKTAKQSKTLKNHPTNPATHPSLQPSLPNLPLNQATNQKNI
jgi:hypothetical protein